MYSLKFAILIVHFWLTFGQLIINEVGFLCISNGKIDFIELKIQGYLDHRLAYRIALLSSCSVNDAERVMRNRPEIVAWVPLDPGKLSKSYTGSKFHVVSTQQIDGADMLFSHPTVLSKLKAQGGNSNSDTFLREIVVQCPVAIVLLQLVPGGSQTLRSIVASGHQKQGNAFSPGKPAIPLHGGSTLADAAKAILMEELTSALMDMWVISAQQNDDASFYMVCNTTILYLYY